MPVCLFPVYRNSPKLPAVDQHSDRTPDGPAMSQPVLHGPC
jgi:hypothetical protein